MPDKKSDKARSGKEADANKVEKAGRAASDSLDKHVGQGIIRDVAHGTWHAGAGIVRGCAGNTAGAKAEFKRSGEHFSNGGKKLMD